MELKGMEVNLRLTENQLGTIPKDKEVYASYIATKTPDTDKGIEEVATVQEIEEKGWTGFHKDAKGIFIYDYMIRGFLKNAGNILKDQLDLKNMASKIDNLVFVFPRRIHAKLDGKTIMQPHGVLERPLRAQTMQGPRVTLARSDFLKEGCEYDFTISIVDNKKGINAKLVKSLFDYGQYCGLGQFRNGSYGRFVAKVKIL